MTKTIVLPLDGSDLSERAVPFALVLGNRLPARVVLVRGELMGPDLDTPVEPPQGLREARFELDRVGARLRDAGVETQWLVINDEGGWAIIDVAREQDADLVVMSTHARGPIGRASLGSIADRVLRDGPAPVLLLPPTATFNWPPNAHGLRILVALDGSPLSELALGPAVEIARATGGELILVHAIQPPLLTVEEQGASTIYALTKNGPAVHEELTATAERLALHGIQVSIEERLGQPADVILMMARQHAAHLIAMATHGRSGPSRLLMGSIAEEVLRKAKIPVLVCGPHALQRGERTATGSASVSSRVDFDIGLAQPGQPSEGE